MKGKKNAEKSIGFVTERGAYAGGRMHLAIRISRRRLTINLKFIFFGNIATPQTILVFVFFFQFNFILFYGLIILFYSL